jgi:hypothetical protein
MSVKTTSSLKTTTNLQTGSTKSFRTTYRTSSTNIGKGGLSSIGRLQMIGISIIVISIGTAVVQFDRDDLIAFNPNYNLINQYQAVEDPLTHYNYISYGENVLGSLIGFVEFLEPFGEFAKAGWTLFFSIASPDSDFDAPAGSFLDEFGYNRVVSLTQMRFSSLKAYYDELTTAEREWIRDNINSIKNGALELGFYETRFYLFVIIDGVSYFFYTEQSVYDYILQLGVGS